MNHLGIALLWVAAQVTLLLVPAVGLYWVASRREAAAGAWAASITFAFVLILSTLALVPGSLFDPNRSGPTANMVVPPAEFSPSSDKVRSRPIEDPPADRASGFGWSFRSIVSRWQAAERTATEQMVRRPSVVAGLTYLIVAAAVFGLLRVGIGIWAIARLRRRGRAIDDPDLQALLAALMAELRCRRRVSLLQTPELAAPATAGWLHPVIFLPDDWPNWTNQTRRAVLAHEIAHIERHDYAWTILARLVQGLHFYHPLLHWLANRLNWQQELAADAVAARVSGGTELYVLTLSRLALGRDTNTPNCAARAFLPARGTLIRRIEMLRDVQLTDEGSWTWRSLPLAVLLVLTLGLATFRGPAWGDSPAEPAVAVIPAKPRAQPNAPAEVEPFDFSYLPEKPQFIQAIHLSALFQSKGMAANRTMINMAIAYQWAQGAKKVGFDPTKPGQQPLRIEMIEQLVAPMRITRTGKGPNSHRIGYEQSYLVKTTEPVDWLGLARLWKLNLVEKRIGDRVYYTFKDLSVSFGDECFYCPDSKTLVCMSEEKLLEKWKRGDRAVSPVFSQHPGWEELRRGVVLIAADNRDGSVAKNLEETTCEDFDFADIFKHTSLMTLGIPQGDLTSLRVVGWCPDAGSGQQTARVLETMLETLRRVALRKTDSTPPVGPNSDIQAKARDICSQALLSFVTGSTVAHEGTTVVMSTSGMRALDGLVALLCLDMAGGGPVP